MKRFTTNDMTMGNASPVWYDFSGTPWIGSTPVSNPAALGASIDDLVAIANSAQAGTAYGVPGGNITPQTTQTSYTPKPPEKTWEQSLNEMMAQLKSKPEYALIGVAVLVLLLKRK